MAVFYKYEYMGITKNIHPWSPFLDALASPVSRMKYLNWFIFMLILSSTYISCVSGLWQELFPDAINCQNSFRIHPTVIVLFVLWCESHIWLKKQYLHNHMMSWCEWTKNDCCFFFSLCNIESSLSPMWQSLWTQLWIVLIHLAYSKCRYYPVLIYLCSVHNQRFVPTIFVPFKSVFTCAFSNTHFCSFSCLQDRCSATQDGCS